MASRNLFTVVLLNFIYISFAFIFVIKVIVEIRGKSVLPEAIVVQR